MTNPAQGAIPADINAMVKEARHIIDNLGGCECCDEKYRPRLHAIFDALAATPQQADPPASQPVSATSWPEMLRPVARIQRDDNQPEFNVEWLSVPGANGMLLYRGDHVAAALAAEAPQEAAQPRQLSCTGRPADCLCCGDVCEGRPAQGQAMPEKWDAYREDAERKLARVKANPGVVQGLMAITAKDLLELLDLAALAHAEPVALLTVAREDDPIWRGMNFIGLTEHGKRLPAGKYELALAQPVVARAGELSDGRMEALYDAIKDVLGYHKLTHQMMDEDMHFPLVDALTPKGDKSIARGQEEIVYLCDAIFNDEAVRAVIAADRALASLPAATSWQQGSDGSTLDDAAIVCERRDEFGHTHRDTARELRALGEAIADMDARTNVGESPSGYALVPLEAFNAVTRAALASQQAAGGVKP